MNFQLVPALTLAGSVALMPERLRQVKAPWSRSVIGREKWNTADEIETDPAWSGFSKPLIVISIFMTRGGPPIVPTARLSLLVSSSYD